MKRMGFRVSSDFLGIFGGTFLTILVIPFSESIHPSSVSAFLAKSDCSTGGWEIFFIGPPIARRITTTTAKMHLCEQEIFLRHFEVTVW